MPLNPRPPGLEKPAPPPPPPPAEYGHSRLRSAYPVWSLWQKFLDGRKPTPAEEAEMHADMRVAMRLTTGESIRD